MSSSAAATATASTPAIPVTDEPDFPRIGYKDSILQWLESKPLSYYEDQVLRLIPFYPEGDATRKSEIIDTNVNDKGDYIHEFYVENTERNLLGEEERHIVLIHGYGASLGFFYRNFDELSRIKGVKIHALDLLGFGLSSRPKFPKYDVKSIGDIHQTEDWFIDSLEEWRKRRKLSKFVLVGHSLGGYLSSCYTLKYANSVEKLVLISPVGVERSEYSLLDDKTSSNTADRPDKHKKDEIVGGPEVSNEYYESQQDVLTAQSSVSSEDINSKIGQHRRAPQLPRWVHKLWERHTSPFTLLRAFGPFAPKVISNWSFRRFGAVENHDQLMAIHKYAYRTFSAKGSGEYALTRLLAPGALARLPLLDRLPGSIKVPSLWLYGDVDWMSKTAGKEICEEINKLSNSPNQKLAKFRILNSAGHHVYLDNPTEFDNSVKKFIGWD